jgi:hypothetical protein
MATHLYIRLKPYNPKRGHVLRRYTYRGVRFYEGRWYNVPEALARELADVHQRHGNEDSPLAFDVATQTQAREIEDAERKKLEEERRKLENAEVVAATEIRDDQVRGALSTADLPKDEPADEDKELGASMANTKDELIDIAESLGLDVSTSMNKAEILAAIEEEAGD